MLLDIMDFPDGHEIRADIIIVGAGAAGITMALDLINSNLSVLLLESGGIDEEPATQDLYAGTVVDQRLHSPSDRYRQRRFGGTTTIWGGRCMPFDPIDFEVRDHVPWSGWPISRSDLEPFYARANAICEAGAFAYTTGAAFGTAALPIVDGFTSPDFSTHHLERFSCPTNFAARYAHKLKHTQNVQVILHANLTQIILDESGTRVEHLLLRTLSGRRLTARAARYVLAAGGLETPRILLANRDRHPHGIGNEENIVGRYYMCHLAGTIGAIQFACPSGAVYRGYRISPDGVYCRQRFALEERAQRREGTGNFIARLHHPRITDPAHRSAILSLLYLAKPLIPYEYQQRLHGADNGSAGDWLRHVVNVITGPVEATGFAWHMLLDRKLAERKFPSIIINSKANLYSIDFHAEQYPNASSRILLDDAIDPLGMPRIKVDWRYLPQDVHTVSRSLAMLARDFAATGVGRLDYDPALVESEMTRYGAYGGHHIGTARMGSDPRSSVVDANCRLHTVRNLYVAGSAVFPTSSQANPTLTIVALALRLAAHLRHVEAGL
ncbi:MAG: FAD-dependent oxidoreductase [Steroidobacteraceae bacterium]